jgi:hypothetical protein
MVTMDILVTPAAYHSMHYQMLLPFTYHEVLNTLYIASVNHFKTESTQAHAFPGHDPVVAAAQIFPRPSPSTPTDHRQSHDRSAPIHDEVCLDIFKFSPFFHDENIRDREVRERAMHFQV